jgi:hypothetical protein
MRILDFSDGFTSATEPTVGGVQANGLKTYASDAAFVSAEGTAADGDIYYNTTADTIRAYINGAWVVVAPVSGGGGGGASLTWLEAVDPPTTTIINNVLHYVFGAGLGQSLYSVATVPSTYQAGDQITLKIKFNSADTSGNVLLQSVATLIRDSDLVTTTTNQRTSTNSAVTLSGATQNKNQTVTLDLTSATAQINSVSVSAGDQIMVRITRGTDTATGDIYVPVYGAEPIFVV